MAGIRFDLITDTRDVKKGFKDVEEALEDVGDSLDDVAKDGEASTEKLEKSFSELARETKAEAKQMGKDVTDSYDKMERGGKEATKQMATDGAAEAEQLAGSFDGSAESIVDGFQGAASSMFSGFGPAGAAAGLAAAAGIGLISAEMQKAQEEAEETAAATDEMVASMLESGSTYVTEQAKLNALEAFLGDTEARKKAEEFADKIGVDLVEFGSAMFGLAGDRENVEQAIQDHYSDQLETYRKLGVTGSDYLIQSKLIKDEEEEALDLLHKQDKIIGDAKDLADRILGKRQEITGQIREEVDVTSELSEDYRKMALIDATPKLNIAAEARKQVAEAQRALDSLRAPDLTVNVRTVR
tara:strand:+ start:1647 stop:2714 length:1068 start_codon:yes stop_codon:yes gene_type:complete